MRKLAIIPVSVILLFLYACSASPANTNDPSSASWQSQVDEPEPTVEIISEDLQIYQNALGDTCATYVAELKNTSSNTVAITNTSIDIEKPDGTLLTSSDFFSPYPRMAAPNGSIYICADIINSNSGEISIDQIGKPLLHFDLEVRPTIEPLSVEITELTLGTEYNWPKFQGRIENTGNTDLENIYISAPIRAKDGSLQGVGFTIVNSLSAGEKKGFEQTCMSCSTALDYSQSSISAFAYDGSLF